MGFNCGIVGLPNVGKSTIFNAMTAAGVLASNYPFCTIDPNVGMVPLKDARLHKLSELVAPEKVTPTTVEFVDIAGLVKGASKGEGLGNQFLGHIRSVDTIAHIVRCFEDPEVIHVSGRVDPGGDIEVINTELMLADLESLDRRINKVEKAARSGDKAANAALDAYKRIKAHLEEGSPARMLPADAIEGIRDLNLLSAKPVVYIANVGEDDLGGESLAAAAVEGIAGKEGAGFVVICGKIESEIAELSDKERDEFLRGLGLKESGLDRLAEEAYRLLGLITFFTAGKKEVRAWTVKRGTKAPQAAGVIHSDFEKGFIRAEVISYEDFMRSGSESACREKGLIRVEGKEYTVRDGDVMHFRFAV
ncbi:MAG: redox-regulated ATPase YchF [Deltaproteobacteria bacterium]|nr:redox-regulated ATPase YchF [Deltaproteobacteria bacterium]